MPTAGPAAAAEGNLASLVALSTLIPVVLLLVRTELPRWAFLLGNSGYVVAVFVVLVLRLRARRNIPAGRMLLALGVFLLLFAAFLLAALHG